MNKKSQAAMEFLMTYGWAIMAAVIAIGVLAYFGVFSPGAYTSGTAIVTTPFYVNAWNAGPLGITLELRNQGGDNYHITGVNIDGCGYYGGPDLDPVDGIPDGWDVDSGALQMINIPCDLSGYGTFKGDITITYTKTGSIIDLTSTGTIAEKVVG